MWTKTLSFAFAAVLLIAPATVVADHNSDALAKIIAERGDSERARDEHRHPFETLSLFELEPGMTIIDTLPGAWYGHIIAPFIGAEGTYVGAQYSPSHQKKMRGDRFDQSRVDAWVEGFAAQVYGWAETSPKAATMFINEAPEEMYGTVDRYFLFRSLHHLNRIDPASMDSAADEAFKLLKPGGIVGVVQHRSPEGNADSWATGDNGYLKQSRVVEAFSKAGFTLEEASEINANPKDKPSDGTDGSERDFVWRLPPSGQATDIGESDRMTLKFRKPAE